MRRRDFLRTGAGFWVATGIASAQAKSPNAKLNLGIIGVTGRGGENLKGVSGENIVALCDVDDRNLEKAAAKFPDARKYNDFRKLLDESKDLDGVVVSTADHVHAFAAHPAIQLGKHVYCEKPLTHSVWESRLLAEAALKKGVKTQMGTQIHAGDNYRRVVELVKSGAVGAIKEVHVWIAGGRIWTAGDRPAETPETPKQLHWDLWLGPSAERPYHSTYHPEGWRRWWDFGGGHLADMGCHYIDLPFWALDLRHPSTCEAEGPPVHAESAPAWLAVTWQFPARGSSPPVKLTWRHGRRPPELDEKLAPKWGAGVLFIGEKGQLLADYGRWKLLPEEGFKDFKPPEPTIPKSAGHHEEWIAAIKTGSGTLCNFDYSGALAETVLLGNVAYRAGKKLEWDAASLKAKNCPEASAFIRRDYRKGWSLA